MEIPQILRMHLHTDGIHIDRSFQEKRVEFDENLVPAKSVSNDRMCVKYPPLVIQEPFDC